MKEIQYQQNFNCSIETFFEQIFFHPQFQTQLHVKRHDLNIKITEWMVYSTNTISNTTTTNKKVEQEMKKIVQLNEIYNDSINGLTIPKMYRRVSFETKNKAPSLVSKTLSIPNDITCELNDELEWILPQSSSSINRFMDEEDGDDLHMVGSLKQFTVKSKMNFTNIPLSDSLNIVATWNVKRLKRNEIYCTLNVQCEFKTSVWGVTGIVESFMESDARRSFDNWFTEAQNYLDQYFMEQPQQQQPQPQQQQKQMTVDSEEEDNSYEAWDSSDEVSSIVSGISQGSNVLSDHHSTHSSAISDDSFYSIVTQKPKTNEINNNNNQTTTTTTTTVAHLKSPLSSSISDGGASSTSTSITKRNRRRGRRFDHEEERRVSIQEPVSVLLDRSVSLANLKQDLREVRALVSKTEVRIEALETEFSNHELDIVFRMYLQRVNELYRKQSEQLELLNKISSSSSPSNSTSSSSSSSTNNHHLAIATSTPTTPIVALSSSSSPSTPTGNSNNSSNSNNDSLSILKSKNQQLQQQQQSSKYRVFWFGLGALTSSAFSIFIWPLILRWLRERNFRKINSWF